MILLISTCREKFHELEFVKPIENILNERGLKFFSKHYKNISEKDLKLANKIIICGTSLQDNQFLDDVLEFEWIKNFEKPVLGICSGMQIISLIFGAKLKSKTEMGFFNENFKKEFLSLKETHEVYHLHNNYPALPKNFIKFNSSKIPQAIKHKAKKIYGVLFHPEVRNKKLIEEFLK